MSEQKNIALLYFSRSARLEGRRKNWASRRPELNRAIASSLILRSTRTVRASGLPVFHYHEGNQKGQTFGERMANAFQEVFALGFEAVISVGNDSPELARTNWQDITARLAEGEYLLVHGGTSGIGTTAIMLASALGARVIATAGSAEKCALCESLGAIRAINYREEDFVEAAKEATGGHGADVILDMVGGDYIGRNYAAAAIEGRIVQIAFLRGARAEVDFTRLLMKRLTHTGSTLRARDIAFKAAIASALGDKVWPLLEAGRIRPIIDSTYPFLDAAKAHARMETNAHMGKIVLTFS